MSVATENVTYSERLWPSGWLYIILLLLVPSTMLLFMPLNSTLGVVLAPIVYVVFAAIFTLASPRVAVAGGEFIAGHANIPTSYIGDVEILDSDELTLAIGIQADARAYLLVRGWIHQAVKVANTDPTDPAPFWIVTTRHPEKLRAALLAAR
ncbi:DUF3093 domain-containing protein [Leucobacter sp. OH2974_COT-288]|uniref:DUF3093 domain-containing protein n=1 Tax=Canibacter oris TaxID=1365628 RepID=A0A840DDI4_9MICO|nr:hypothetical protein [Canibacter oris]RRD36311.1 DUF3093 domain-containing protein [Leucobacter sp. OH2974_COT-288]